MTLSNQTYQYMTHSHIHATHTTPSVQVPASVWAHTPTLSLISRHSRNAYDIAQSLTYGHPTRPWSRLRKSRRLRIRRRYGTRCLAKYEGPQAQLKEKQTVSGRCFFDHKWFRWSILILIRGVFFWSQMIQVVDFNPDPGFVRLSPQGGACFLSCWNPSPTLPDLKLCKHLHLV